MNNSRLYSYSKEANGDKFSRDVESRIEAAEDLHNGNLNSCIKYSSLTALKTDVIGEATPPSRRNSRKQRPTGPTPCSWWNAECDKQPSGSFSTGAQEERILLVTRKQKPKLEMG
jgi:hypothetical protein